MESRAKNCQELNKMLFDVFLTRPRDEWVQRLNEQGGGLAFDIINTATDLAQVELEHLHQGGALLQLAVEVGLPRVDLPLLPCQPSCILPAVRIVRHSPL